MKNRYYIKSYLVVLFTALLLSSCAKESLNDNNPAPKNPMLFGVEKIAQTKVAYTEETDGKISAAFEPKVDEIGLYAFYNNFYVWYDEYQNFAESVIFSNQGMEVDDNGYLTYSPLKSWTFSTIYGTAPHTVDVEAYYPFKANYNDDMNLAGDEKTGASTLIYKFKSASEVKCDVDFMTSHRRIDEYEDKPIEFREAMLALRTIELQFTRRTAAMNIKVSKPSDFDEKIVVNSIAVEFNAPTLYTQTISNVDVINWTLPEDMTFSKTLTTAVELEKTNWNGMPSTDMTNSTKDLFAPKDMLHFPPGTVINKITFGYTVTSASNVETSSTYNWHPHTAPTLANTSFTLNIELNPIRNN